MIKVVFASIPVRVLNFLKRVSKTKFQNFEANATQVSNLEVRIYLYTG